MRELNNHKKELSESIEKDIKLFLKKGGSIKVLGYGLKSTERKRGYNGQYNET